MLNRREALSFVPCLAFPFVRTSRNKPDTPFKRYVWNVVCTITKCDSQNQGLSDSWTVECSLPEIDEFIEDEAGRRLVGKENHTCRVTASCSDRDIPIRYRFRLTPIYTYVAWTDS